MRAKLDMKTASAIAAQDMTLKEHEGKAPDLGFHEDRFSTTDKKRVLSLGSAPIHNEVWWSELHTQIQNLPAAMQHERHDLEESLEKALRELGSLSSRAFD